MRKAIITPEDEQEIVKLVLSGKQYIEIAHLFDVTATTISKYARKHGIRSRARSKPMIVEVGKPFNKDRHLCRTCKYRHKDVDVKSKSTSDTAPGCDYCIHNDGMRIDICSVERCTVYKRGKRLIKEEKQDGEELG